MTFRSLNTTILDATAAGLTQHTHKGINRAAEMAARETIAHTHNGHCFSKGHRIVAGCVLSAPNIAEYNNRWKGSSRTQHNGCNSIKCPDTALIPNVEHPKKRQ